MNNGPCATQDFKNDPGLKSAERSPPSIERLIELRASCPRRASLLTTRKSVVKDTNPNTAAICVLLARGDHVAGILLDRVRHWGRYGKAKISGSQGEWIANDREWWMREAQLSAGQLDRSLAKLAKFELIERRQFKFAGRNIMHVRPSEFTADILAASKTWGAAAEILAQAKIPVPDDLAKLAAIDPPLIKMLEAWGDEVTAQDIGALAVFRQEMKAFPMPGGLTYASP
jgi:hypothetical protein